MATRPLAYRLQLLWEPNDKFSGLFKVHGWEVSDGTARIFRANIIEPGTSNLVGGFSAGSGLAGRPQQPGDHVTWRSAASGVRLRWRHPDVGHRLREHPRHVQPGRHRRWLRCGLPGRGQLRTRLHPLPVGVGRRHARASTSGPRSSGSPATAARPVNWLVGFFYFNEEVKIDNFSYDTLAPGNPQNVCATQYQETTAYALFGSLNWAVSDTWDLAGGLRYSNDDKDFWVAMPQKSPLDSTPRRADYGARRRQLRELGSQRHLQGQPERQRLRPPRHRLPCAVRSRAGSRSVPFPRNA